MSRRSLAVDGAVVLDGTHGRSVVFGRGETVTLRADGLRALLATVRLMLGGRALRWRTLRTVRRSLRHTGLVGRVEIGDLPILTLTGERARLHPVAVARTTGRALFPR